MSARKSDLMEERCVLECGLRVGDSKTFEDSALRFNLLGKQGVLFGSQRDQ